MRLLASQSPISLSSLYVTVSKQMKPSEDVKELVKSLAENLSVAKNQILALKANQAESPEQPGNATELSAGGNTQDCHKPGSY